MKIKILIVDDETEFADALSERLKLREYDASVAYTGDQALEVFESNSFDIVILDVQMPGITGLETLQRLKEMAPLSQVIMLTGHGTVPNAVEGMRLGAYDFLMKPVDTELLLSKINEAYQLKHEHEERIRNAEVDFIINRRGW